MIDIGKARLQQGDTIAAGSGKLSLNAQGYLQGQMMVTVAGLEHFLNAIGADMAVKKSPEMDKVAGFLDRLAPGLGNVAREQAGAHITFGIKAIEGNATLEGKPAVTLPLALRQRRDVAGAYTARAHTVAVLAVEQLVILGVDLAHEALRARRS